MSSGPRPSKHDGYKPRKFATQMVHAGEIRPGIRGAVSLPIFQSSTYEFHGDRSDYHDVKYIRLNNTPNHEVLGRKLASLENAEAGLVAGSGMAAITAAMLAVLRSGDHLLAQRTLYGGTQGFLGGDIRDFGIDVTLVEGNAPGTWKGALRKNTKAFYVEALTNPTLEVADLEAVAEFSKVHRLVSLIDNTFPSPFNFRPLDLGFDISLHSASKYLNGHTDIVAGAALGSAELIDRIKKRLDHLGGTLDPHAGFLLNRGLKTLSLRMERHNENALALARSLEGHPRVRRVLYTGLESHPNHERAQRLFLGHSGMLAFEPEGGEAGALRVIERLCIPIHAPSLGGVETLVTRPVTTSHVNLPAGERQAQGISDAMIRVSVGVEDSEELIDDFRQALEKPV